MEASQQQHDTNQEQGPNDSGLTVKVQEELQKLRQEVVLLKLELEKERKVNAALHAQIMVNKYSGLPGMQALITKVSAIIDEDQLDYPPGAMAVKRGFCLAKIKLDSQFDLISRTLKHSVSEWILFQTGVRIGELLKPEEQVFHVNDDEYVVVLHETDPLSIGKRLRQIQENLKRHHSLSGVRLHLGNTIGAAIYPNNGKNHASILDSANIALSHGIQTKETIVIFKDQYRKTIIDKMELQNDLVRALEAQSKDHRQKQFKLLYQPQVHIGRKDDDTLFIKQINAEVLMRWHHPVRGVISPNNFIPLAEETGLIQLLGTWLVHKSAEQVVRWRETALAPVILSINVSPRQFLNDQLVYSIDRILKRQPGLAAKLKLEITESSLLENTETCLTYMNYLRKLGLQFAVDDFGRDYSSLSYLRRLPVSTLKIDKSFITSIETNNHDQAIVSAVTRLAKDLDLNTIVEGVENPGQLQKVLELGCNTIQGYYFSTPISEDEFILFYKKTMGKKIRMGK